MGRIASIYNKSILAKILIKAEGFTDCDAVHEVKESAGESPQCTALNADAIIEQALPSAMDAEVR